MKIREERNGFRKLWLVLGVFAVLLFGTALTASAATIYQQGVEDKAISIRWDNPILSWGSDYIVDNYKIYVGNSDTDYTYKTTVSGNTTSYRITGLAAGKEYYVRVECNYTFHGKYTTRSDSVYAALRNAPTRLAAVGGFVIDADDASSNAVRFKWNTNQDVDGYVWLLKNKKGSVVDSGDVSYLYSYDISRKAKPNTIYTIELKAYSKAVDSSTKVYGPASTIKYYPQPKMKKLKLVNGNKIKVSWKKVSGATKYIVYGSTKANKGYKKIATVKKSKSSYVVSKVKGKKLKKYQNYYFKVQAVYGKKKSSKTNYDGGYIYTTYR
ncbi:MAG: fibronectin type III domain-containing protein [Eubacterium sp.]|nr:fibronectin type III domain-containing protein [Eubacterium sp.]